MNQKIYKGIRVRAAFNEGDDDGHKQDVEEDSEVERDRSDDEVSGLEHLSGGQQTVVVVALIFAVLRMEAAPFYILDEFDHALDSQYRQAIAGLIAELSEKSQFLITTFKPELIETTDASIFEIQFANRRSQMVPMDKAGAVAIIKA